MFKQNADKLFLGRLLSSAGDSLYQVAVIWYIFDLTNDVFYTGLATAIVMVPKIFNFIFGPLIEMMDKRKILVYSQFIQFLLMLSVTVFIILGYESVWMIIIFMFLVSLIENFEGTAEIALVPTLIDSSERGKFNAKIGGATQVVDLIMKGIFAVSIIIIGIETVYIFNTTTYLLAALLFLFIKVKKNEDKKRQFDNMNWKDYKKDLKDGFIYFFTTKVFIISMPFLVANFCFGMTEAILPAYAAERGGSGQYGIYIIAITLGSLIGTSIVVYFMKYPLGHLLIFLPFLSFLLWGGSILIENKVISLIMFGLAFIPFGMMNILLITFLQVSVDESLLARVSSIIDSVLVSAMPLGALIGGLLPKVIGISGTMLISCCGLLVITFSFLFNKKNRSLPNIEEIQI